MATMSTYLENYVLDSIFRGQPMLVLSNTYIGLFKDPLTASSTSPYTTEISKTRTGYARTAIPGTLDSWTGTDYNTNGTPSIGYNGKVSNNVSIIFPLPTGNWGVANSFGIFDTATNGNLLFYGQLLNEKTINNGDAAPLFTANTLSFQIDNQT